MDVLLQRHCAKYIYAIPDGLRELMSDISREVLRSYPEQIYSFIADYLDALMITRENARVAAKFVESITEVGVTIADLLVRTGMTREEADRVATIIQVAFRKYYSEKAQFLRHGEEPPEETIIEEILDRCNLTFEQANEAAIIIQNAYRAFKDREKLAHDLLKGMVDWRVAARSTLRLYRKSGHVTYEEANRASTLIKAAYKGYYTRRIMKRLLEESEMEKEVKDRFETCTQMSLTYDEQVNFFNLEEERAEILGYPLDMELHGEGQSYPGLGMMDDLLPKEPIQTGSVLEIPHPSFANMQMLYDLQGASEGDFHDIHEEPGGALQDELEGGPQEEGEGPPAETPTENPPAEETPAEGPPQEAPAEEPPPAEAPAESPPAEAPAESPPAEAPAENPPAEPAPENPPADAPPQEGGETTEAPQ